MGFLSQRYADLTGTKIGHFYVDDLVGGAKNGAPTWRIVCSRCSYPQTYEHVRLVQVIQAGPSAVLYCANNACPLSKTERQVDSLADVRRAERKEAQAAQAAAEAKRLSEERAAAEQRAKQQAYEAWIEPLRAEYGRYARCAMIHWNVDLKDLPGLTTWTKISEQDRARIMAKVNKEIAEDADRVFTDTLKS
jgi:hypothetical protein